MTAAKRLLPPTVPPECVRMEPSHERHLATTWRDYPAIAISASATRPARSTSMAGGSAPLRSMRWATTRRRAIRSTSTGRFSSSRDAASEVAYGLFYDTLSDRDLRSRLRVRQLPRVLPLLRDRRRRPRLLRVRRPDASATSTRKFMELTGRMALGPALEPRLRRTRR